jgi:hypothetical protein
VERVVGGYRRNVGRTIEAGRRRKGRDGQGTREQGDGCATWFESFGTALWRHLVRFANSFVSWSLVFGVWSLLTIPLVLLSFPSGRLFVCFAQREN